MSRPRQGKETQQSCPSSSKSLPACSQGSEIIVYDGEATIVADWKRVSTASPEDCPMVTRSDSRSMIPEAIDKILTLGCHMSDSIKRLRHSICAPPRMHRHIQRPSLGQFKFPSCALAITEALKSCMLTVFLATNCHARVSFLHRTLAVLDGCSLPAKETRLGML